MAHFFVFREVKFLRLSAAQGYAQALHLLARSLLENDEATAEDKLEAMRLFHLASDQGHSDARKELGKMFLSGNGVGVNKANAARFLRLAADLAEAQVFLARMLFDGDGVPQDKEEALRLYRLAADSNNADAEFELGKKFLNGRIDAGTHMSKE
jgi:uncharacterized protein